MATLVLTAVGSIIGGPIGGAIGALIGNQVDHAIFAPGPRDGPRLTDLTLQSSTYGATIPALFGKTRVSGSVIWATNIKETRSTQSNGKGKPKTNIYSYSASFAVALSVRRAARVGRIWADGKLLRGEAGDFKVETRFRFHNGRAGQASDPLIAALEGATNTPAYRGLAYAVFEDLQLADYGNRIPSLSFEVIADEGDVSINTVLQSIIAGSVETQCPTMLAGFVATGSSARAIVEGLDRAISLNTSATNGLLTISEAIGVSKTISFQDLGAAAGDKTSARTIEHQQSSHKMPTSMMLRYYDAARDYQLGSQRAWLGQPMLTQDQIDFPATLTADAAAIIAERKLGRRSAERKTAEITLPWRHLSLLPNQALNVSGISGERRITSIALDGMALKIRLAGFAPVGSFPSPSDPGRNTTQIDAIHGPTRLIVVDLPPLEDGLASTPHVFATASGTSPGWRQASLLMSLDNGAQWAPLGSTVAPATMGITNTILPAGDPFIVDRKSSLNVTLNHAGMQLNDTDFDGLIAGRNLALVGDELIQFEKAVPIDPGVYRLSGLLRGRRGTEWAMRTQPMGTRFVLIERESLLPLSVPVGAHPIRVMASGLGDTLPVEASLAMASAAILPISVCHLAAELMPDGDQFLRWIRRSREGWRWIDAVDAPLGEEGENYEVIIAPETLPTRTYSVGNSQWIYASADRVADKAAGATQALVSVRQLGTYGQSRPTTITLAL